MENNNLQHVSDKVIQIDLIELGRTIWKNALKIIIAALVCGIITLAVTVFVIKPTYRVSFSAYVNNRTTSESVSTINSSDVSASQVIAKTYSSIITSRDIINAAIIKSGVDESIYQYEYVKGCISTSVDDGTQLINVYVTLENAEDAYALAEAISEVAPEYASEIVEGTSMKIVDSPVLPTHHFSPNIKKNTAVGAAGGFMLMLLYIVVSFLMDQTVKNEEDVERKFGIPVIGIIPDFETAGHNGYSNYGYYGNGKKTSQDLWKKAKNNSDKESVNMKDR